MKTKVHVQDFLLAADPKTGLADIFRTIADTAKHDKGAIKAINALASWVNKPWVSKEAQAVFDKIPHHHVPSVLSQSPAASTLLGVVYLFIEQNILADTRRPSFFASMRKAVAKSDECRRKLEPKFLDELLIQTEDRAAKNPHFAKALVEAANSLNNQRETLLKISTEIAEIPGIKIPTVATNPGTLALSDSAVLTLCFVGIAIVGFGFGVAAGAAVALK
jgi:hypothetical protein